MSSCLRELADYCVVIGKPLALLCVVLASLRSVVSTPTGYASTVSRKLCGALHIRALLGVSFMSFKVFERCASHQPNLLEVKDEAGNLSARCGSTNHFCLKTVNLTQCLVRERPRHAVRLPDSCYRLPLTSVLRRPMFQSERATHRTHSATLPVSFRPHVVVL